MQGIIEEMILFNIPDICVIYQSLQHAKAAYIRSCLLSENLTVASTKNSVSNISDGREVPYIRRIPLNEITPS